MHLAGEHWVRWNTNAAKRFQQLVAAIEQFDAGERPAAQASARWLREEGLDGESIPYLWIMDGELVGFYALTAGQVELSTAHSRRLQVGRPTQGALLVTQIAKSARHDVDGSRLIADALGTAAELARGFGATVLAVDPYDRETDAMWRQRFGFRASRTRIGNADDDAPLKRLYLPIPSS